MTKEEAIELLEDLDGAIEDNQGRDYDEAFRMAIEALKREIERHEMVIRAMEQMLIDVLRMVPNKDIQAILLEAYTQEYGAISDENGEIVRQILMEKNENERW